MTSKSVAKKTFPLLTPFPSLFSPNDKNALPSLTAFRVTPAEGVLSLGVLLAAVCVKDQALYRWFWANRRAIVDRVLSEAGSAPREPRGVAIPVPADIATRTPTGEEWEGRQSRALDLMVRALESPEFRELHSLRGKYKTRLWKPDARDFERSLLHAYDCWVAHLRPLVGQPLKVRYSDPWLMQLPPALLTPEGRCDATRWAKLILAHQTNLSVKTIEKHLTRARRNSPDAR